MDLSGLGPTLVRLLASDGAQELLSELFLPGKVLDADVISVFEDHAMVSLGKGIRLEVTLQTPVKEGQKLQLQVQPRTTAPTPNGTPRPIVLKLLNPQTATSVAQATLPRSAAQVPTTAAQATPASPQLPGTPEPTPAPAALPTNEPQLPGTAQATTLPAGLPSLEPQLPAAGQIAATQAAPQAAASQAAASQAATPAGAAPQAAGTQSVAPQATAPQATAPQVATPAGAAPQATLPQAGPSQAAVLPKTLSAPPAGPGVTASPPSPAGPGVPSQSPTPAAPLPNAPIASPGAPAPAGQPAPSASRPASPPSEAVAGQSRPQSVGTPEARLPAAAVTPVGPQATDGPALQSDLASAVSRAVRPEVPVSGMLPQVQNSQNVVPQMVWLPIPLPQGGQAWAQLVVQDEPEREARGGAVGPAHQVKLWWETPALGSVQVTMDARDKNLTAVFTTPAIDTRQAVELGLPDLQQRLAAAGFPEALLGSRQPLPGESVTPVGIATGSGLLDKRM